MKKEYITPIVKRGITLESNLLVSSLSGDGLQMDINETTAYGDAESRRGSFWEDTE